MKILVVDDEPAIVHLIKMNLKMEGYDTVGAYTGREAIEAYSRHKPDIVLLDIMLPDMEGYDVLRSIHEIDRAAAVIFITANEKRTSKILGLELGADDYITKPFDNKELVLRVKTLWRRISIDRSQQTDETVAEQQTTENQSLLFCEDIIVDGDAYKVWAGSREVMLTYREFDLLCYMMRNRKRVLGREELLENIWGYSYMGNTRAVDILIARMRDKLGPCGAYIKTIYGVGYKFDGEKAPSTQDSATASSI